MKFPYAAVLGAVLLASSAQAAAPPPNASMLGEVDAVIAFCNSIDNHHRHQWADLRQSLIGKQSDRTLDAIEQTADYHQAYSFIDHLLGGAPHDWAVKSCADTLPALTHDDRLRAHEDR